MTPSELSQVRSVAPVLLAALAQGLTLGWGSPAVGKLRAGEGPFTPTIDEISWIVSFFSLGILAGSLGGSAVFARVGRRATLMLGPVLLSACSALLFLAPSAQPLYLARLLGGAGHGVGVSFASIYVAEVTDAVLRGRLILMVNLLIMTGPLLSYALAPHLSYGVLSLGPLATASAALVLALGLGWMRETPLYLSSKGRADEALATLRALRQGCKDEEIRTEFAAIQKTVKAQQSAGGTSLREVLADPVARRAAVLCFVVQGSFAALGVTTVLAFTQQIFERAGTPVRPEVSAASLIAIKVVMVLVSMFLIERLGRRLQLGLGALTNSLAMLGLSCFFLARDTLGADVSAVQWLPLLCLTVFISATGVGVNAVPQVLMSELLSQRAKAVVAPVAVVVVSLTSFGLNKAFLLVGGRYGFHLPFALYALTNMAVSIFTFLVVPETKGKTLAEVQDMLRGMAARKTSWRPADGVVRAKNSLELTYVFGDANKTSLALAREQD